MIRTRNLLPALLAAAVATLGSEQAAAAPVAYTNANLHPISSPEVAGGTLVVEDGKIVAAGAGVAIPAGAEIVDLGGRHVWPGIIDAATDLGLVEIGAARATNDTREMGDWNADLEVEVAFHPDSRRLLPALAGGVTTAHVVPDGDLFTGASAVMRLDGWTWEEMTLAAPVGQHLVFPRMIRPASSGFGGQPPKEDEFEKEKKAKLARLDELIAQAKGYDRARNAAASGDGPAVDVDPKLEAFRAVVAGRAPLFLWADEKTQIEKALDWARVAGLSRLVLVSGPDAAYVADRLALEKIAVILQGVHRLPDRSWEPYDAPFTAAARLHAAGVAVAFNDGGDSSNARTIPFQVATAVAHGLPRDVGHAAMTLTAARILGVDDRVGSLEPGREATFYVADGDPLEIRTRIERVFVRGQEVDLTRDPQWQLWERYRSRPDDRPAPGN
jgi:imidazolonepropionase-like amidohydrolase